jgi:flavin reductase (DIM6/NTAB) family NADH-FMN oxidoreductase RutF
MSVETRPLQESIFSLTNHEVYIITARDNLCENGQIATWILPATLASGAQRVIAVLSPKNYTHDLIVKSRRFVLHMLAEEQYKLLPLFGLMSGRAVNKFKGMALTRTRTGLPVLPDTCGWMECCIVAGIDSGDRMIYLADVVEQHSETFRTPLRKKEAFIKQSDEDRKRLEEKYLEDGLRDAELLRIFI